MTAVIAVKNMSKYFGKVRALEQLTLSLDAGLPIGLVGPNGAGKTTFFSLLCGFLRPSSGHIEVLGRPPLHKSTHGRIGILPQDAAMVRGVPIITQLTCFAELQGFARRAARQEAQRVLALVDLSEKARQAPELLSHGMRKRVAIGQAFIGQPELVLLDEPTAGLDPYVAKRIRTVIRNASRQQTFIISSHNLDDIEDLCQSVIILHNGRLAQYRPLAELVERTTSLVIRLERSLPNTVREQIEALTTVAAVETDPGGEPGVLVNYPEASGDSVQIEVLQILQQAGIGFIEMKRGQSLGVCLTSRLTPS